MHVRTDLAVYRVGMGRRNHPTHCSAKIPIQRGCVSLGHVHPIENACGSLSPNVQNLVASAEYCYEV